MKPTSKIILYEHPREIALLLPDNNVVNYNPPMNRSDFIIVQGADTTIDFVIRNNDRRPVNLVGRQLHFIMVDIRNGELIIKKRCYVVDPVMGRCQLRLFPTDIVEIDPSFYSYSVISTRSDGTQELLLTDLNQTVRGYIEVREGILPRVQEPYEVKTHPWTSLTPVSVGDPPQTQYRSGALPGDSQSRNGDALHTIAIYCSDFTGRLWVQGSLLNEPTSTDADWFTIDVGTGGPIGFFHHTGLEAFNFFANSMWIRFILHPDMLNEGHIEKILLKN